MNELHIKNFRGIRELHLPALAPLTIITGPGGSGRTSVLDAMQVHATRGDPVVLREILVRAGEIRVTSGSDEVIPAREALFPGCDESLEIGIEDGRPEQNMAIRAESQQVGDILSPSLMVQAGGINMSVVLDRETDWRFRRPRPTVPVHPYPGRVQGHPEL